MTSAANSRVAIPLTLAAPFPPPHNGRLRQLAGVAMGTNWSVKFIGTDAAAQTLNRAITAVLSRIIAQMSPWEPASDLSRFNGSAEGGAQTLPAEFCAVIDTGLRIARETGGAFDPAMGALVNLWGFGPVPRGAGIPAPHRIAQALSNSGWRHLIWNACQRQLQRARPVELDLNGIAKGYAVDLVMATLRAHGIHHGLVEIGGELCGSGMKLDGTPWWVSIERPRQDLADSIAPPLLVALHDLAIATSGCERSYISGDRHYAHTIDPRNGMPLRNDMVSATVLHASCMEADGYATALMVMGADAAMAFAARMNLAAAILFRSTDGRINERTTPALEAMLS